MCHQHQWADCKDKHVSRKHLLSQIYPSFHHMSQVLWNLGFVPRIKFYRFDSLTSKGLQMASTNCGGSHTQNAASYIHLQYMTKGHMHVVNFVTCWHYTLGMLAVFQDESKTNLWMTFMYNMIGKYSNVDLIY